MQKRFGVITAEEDYITKPRKYPKNTRLEVVGAVIRIIVSIITSIIVTLLYTHI